MHVLGISGSMRPEGNTALLVQKILEGIDHHGMEEITTEFISLAGKQILPCRGCEKCKKKKWCIFEEDDWGNIARRILECDVLVLGSPAYYFDVCGQLKNFIDRTYSLYHDRKLAGRGGVAVAVCADRGGERTLETLEGFLSTHEFNSMGYVLGKGYHAGDVLKDKVAMEKARETSERIVRLYKKKSH